MIRVRLAEGIEVNVNTDDPNVAAQAARTYFRGAYPDQFEEWRRTQMGLGTSVRAGAARAIDEFQGQLYSAAEGLGQMLNMPNLQQIGREGRIRNAIEAEAAQPEALRTNILEAGSLGDVGRAAAEIVTGSLPQTGGALAGALTGARLGAGFGPVGALVGGIAGGTAASFLPTAGANIQRQIQEEAQRQGVPESEITQVPSPGAAFGAAVPQAALESAADVATLGAGRFLRRPATEVAGSLGQRVGRGAAVGAATEPPTEIAQTAIERYQAGLPLTGPEAGREYLEAGLGGAIAGGVLGGATRGAFGARPAPAPTPEAETAPAPAAEAAPAPAPRFEPIALPERPEPFTTAEEAEAFVAENPQFTPSIPLPTPEAAVQFINTARLADWQQSVTTSRQQAIDEFLAKPAPVPEGQTAMPVDRQQQIGELISNVAPAIEAGTFNLNNFNAPAVARAALGARDIDPGRISKTELKAVTDELNALAKAGYLKKPTPRTFALNTEPVTPLAPARAEEQQAVQAFTEAEEAGTLTPEIMQRMGAAPIQPTVVPEDEAALWQGYSLNAGPQNRSPFVQTARNIAQQRQRPFTRPELGEFASALGAAPTPEAQRAVIDDFTARRQAPAPTAGPTPTTSADAAKSADPASGAGATTETAEEALLTPPKNMPLKQSRKLIDNQYRDSFEGGIFAKLLASPIAFFSKQPRYQASADMMDRYYVRNHQGLSDVTTLYTPILELPAESQARAVMALQDASVNRRMWNRDQFSAQENAAMDGVIASMQRQLDFIIDSYVTEYFNPENAANPQERARLEAFQQKKGDRLIFDMPAEEVRAASPQGFAAAQSYNKIRNPFYIPQIAQGSHFVAAYERLPGGKKRLVRIYFYNPIRGIQKARRALGAQRDFEAIAKQRLREEFPDNNRYYVMERGVESTVNEEAANLRRDGDFIAKYLEELRQVSGKEAKQVIARMSNQIDKAQMDRIFRPNNDKLRAVIPENAVDYVRETMPNYLIAANRLQARRAVREDFNRSLEGYNNEERKYWDDTFNYASTPTEAFGTGRALAFFTYLGFNFSTAVIQFTQNPTVLVPRLLRDGGGAIDTTRYALSAAKDVYGTLDIMKSLGNELDYTNSLIKRGTLTADEVNAIKQGVRSGRLNPVQAVELRSSISAEDFRKVGAADKDATAIAKGANKVVDLSGRMLAAVDETNRLTAFLSAYRLAKARPDVMARAGRLDNREYRTPYEYAEAVVGDTNFRSVKEDRALIQRFHPIAEVMTQFMSPVFKLMEIYARSAAQTIRGLKTGDLEMARAAALQFAAMTTIQVALAGIWSLPLAERMRELIEFVMKEAFEDPVDLEQQLERFLGNGFLASLLSYGLPHAQGTISLNSRLKIDPLPQGSVTEWDALSLLGPVGGFGTKAADFYNAYKMGDTLGMLYAFPLMPTAAANLIKAGQLAIDEEQWTKRGGRIIAPEDVRKAAASGFVPPSVQQAVGFAPPEFADIRRGAARVKELENLNRDPTQRANLELSRLLLRVLEAQRDGRQADAERYSNDYRRRFEEIAREQEDKPEAQKVRLNPQAILSRAQQDLLGRGSPEVLTRQARVPAREEAARIAEEARWRERP